MKRVKMAWLFEYSPGVCTHRAKSLLEKKEKETVK
jgi:hypothetical protein